MLALLTGCGSPDSASHSGTAKVNQPCGGKPNCVSTLDSREEHNLAPFILSSEGIEQWQHIEEMALSLPGASLATKTDHYFRVECTSKVFQFVDDFEVKKQANQLVVRSESRIGYSDFGVNRNRADSFRAMLEKAGYLSHK
ncbi:DUF1499 domain-containing protein [Photobacterium lutimaris]|uniref:DUF1499 domain-containing protein n=2 Tax=Photobacterium lutimaris TaxID=388278 RepID=A0A2T3IUT9_9GAMM|nr:DUF1499 domain-containing protein [Photobacterium lutimaris]